MDLGCITVDTVKKLKMMEHTYFYWDLDKETIVFSGKSLIRLTNQEERTIKGYYKRYINFTVNGGSCKECNLIKTDNVLRGFREFMTILRKKYSGGVKA